MDLHIRIEDAIQSFFLEEYRGDLGQAYDEILQYESQQSETDRADPEQTAYLLQSKIRVYMLLGRLHDAYVLLDEFKILVDQPVLGGTTTTETTTTEGRIETKKLAPYWGLRYAASKAFVDYHRRYPPCLRYQHEPQAPTNMSMIQGVAGPNDITAELIQNTQKYSANIAPEDAATHQTEVQICLLFQVLVNFPHQLRFLATKHPGYPDGVWKKRDDDKSAEEIIAQASPYLHKFVAMKPIDEEKNETTLFFHRLYVETHYALASSSKETRLQTLYNAYQRLGDKTGMANCKLIEADNLLSPPFTSPVSQNLIPIPNSNASGGHDIWDPIEAKFGLKESETADQRYEQALLLFQESNSPRGQAAVLLRQASILHARACSLDHRNTSRIPLLESASVKYSHSLALFGLDSANAQLVKANQILLDISLGTSKQADLKLRAAEIGTWGRENRNELVSYHIGRLMLRFARREWRKYSRFDTANACYECAYECCTALNALVPAFIALFSRAEMQDEMNNFVAVTILAEQCIAMVDSVVASQGRQIAAIPIIEDNSTGQLEYMKQLAPMRQLERRHMLNEKYMFLFTFNNGITRLLARTNAADTYQAWGERYQWYEENDESFSFLKPKSSDDDDKYVSSSSKSDIAQRVFGTSLDKVMQIAALDDAVTKKYRAADMQFNKCISDGDLDRAEAAIHAFINESSAEFERIYTRDLFQMLAYNRIADTPNMRRILDSLTDSELFNGKLEQFLDGRNIDFFFSSLANNALFACVIAEDWSRGFRMLDLSLKIRPKFLQENPSDTLVGLSMRLVSAATLYLNNDQPETAFRLLLKARQLTELGRSQTSDVDVKVGALNSGRMADSFLLLANICLRWAERNLPISTIDGYEHAHPSGVKTWEEHALLFMEEARARALIDSLLSLTETHSDEEEKRRMSESIYKRRALTHLNSIPKRTAEQDRELEELTEEIKGLEIGSWSSSANELMNTLNSELVPQDLYGHLGDDVVAIEASFSRSGCILMAVTHNGIQAYCRNAVRDVDIRKLVMELMQIMREMDGLHNPEEQARKARVEELSGQISDIILTPFANIIRQKRHIIFSVSQPLTAFPFSALLFDGKPLFLHAAVSQTPSLTALYHLSKRRAESSVPTVSVFTKAVSYDEQSSTNERASNKERSLPMAGVEAISISNLFSTWPIEASTLSRTQFRSYIQGQTSILHIGTHGTIDAENPLLSSISIGEEFRVLDMSSIQSSANLLVFAACLSGLGRATPGNDVLGFTHVVLGTGCQAYIGTLFEVSDFASMVLMTLFYRQIKDGPKLSLAEALRRAQVEFCGFDEHKAGAFLDGLLETWDYASASADGSSKSPADIVPDGKYLLTLQKMLLAQIDWSSPIFWASFVLMGYGDFCFT